MELEREARLLLEQHPQYGIVWKLLCVALQMQGKDALFALQKAAEFLPEDAEAHNNLGITLQQRGQLNDAVISYRRALALKPDIADLHNNLGNALKDLGQLEEAVASYRTALRIQPTFAEVHSNLGNVLKEIGQVKEAVACFRQTLELKPDFAEGHNNLAIALHDLGRLDDAVAGYRRAIEINPRYAEAHNNLGEALQALGQFEAALASYRQALEINPGYADAHINYAHLLLALGQFETGWREYEWRPANKGRSGVANATGSMSQPSSNGKRILLLREQGIGDEIFFLRFAPQLREQALWLGYSPGAKIRSLIERSECVDQVVSELDKALPADLTAQVGSLPLLLGGDIPKPLRLFPAEPDVVRVRQHLHDLGLVGQRLLGVTWRGGVAPIPGQRRTLFKRIGLDLLANTITDWDGAILVLQREPLPDEIEQLRAGVTCPVYDFSAYNDDLEAVLALLDLVDEYVGVSNANMHLIAGLRKTARVLIPSPAEWRWMASGDQSPWFPGFALYRQTPAGDWSGALADLARDLRGQ